jgi:hypothetical protein
LEGLTAAYMYRTVTGTANRRATETNGILTVISRLALLVLLGTLWPAASGFAALACDSLRREPCEGEACLAKYKAIQNCETAVIAEEQARRRRQQLRQREYQNRLKKELDAAKE